MSDTNIKTPTDKQKDFLNPKTTQKKAQTAHTCAVPEKWYEFVAIARKLRAENAFTEVWVVTQCTQLKDRINYSGDPSFPETYVRNSCFQCPIRFCSDFRFWRCFLDIYTKEFEITDPGGNNWPRPGRKMRHFWDRCLRKHRETRSNLGGSITDPCQFLCKFFERARGQLFQTPW